MSKLHYFFYYGAGFWIIPILTGGLVGLGYGVYGDQFAIPAIIVGCIILIVTPFAIGWRATVRTFHIPMVEMMVVGGTSIAVLWYSKKLFALIILFFMARLAFRMTRGHARMLLRQDYPLDVEHHDKFPR